MASQTQPLLGAGEYGPQDAFEELPTQDSKPKVSAITRNSTRKLGKEFKEDIPKHPVPLPVEEEIKIHEPERCE